MEKLVKQLIDARKSKTHVGDSQSYELNILKLERGVVCKGHRGSIVYGKNGDNQYLRTHNSYYDGHIAFEYNFQGDYSRIDVSITMDNPKYLQRFHSKITEKGKYTVGIDSPKSILDNSTELMFDHSWLCIKHSIVMQSFVPLSHYENIKLVESMRIILKRFKSIIRENANSNEFCNSDTFKCDKKKEVYIAKSLYN